MISKAPIIVFDFEGGGKNPHKCEPIQLAAVVIDARTLEVQLNNKFCSLMKPENFDNLEQEALDITGITKERLMQNDVPSQKDVWKSFVKFIKKNTYSAKFYDKPIPAGHNIIGYDLIIVDRLCQKYKNIDKEGRQNIFNRIFRIDSLNWCWQFFENRPEPLKYSMDSMRDFLGMSKENAHDALVDTLQTAKMISKMQKFFRKLSAKTDFKGKMNDA